MRKCIYCLEEKTEDQFSKEHVLNEAFGVYDNAPPRLDCVCTCCNQHFGDTIDLALARGTFEGLLRHARGLVGEGKDKSLRDSLSRLEIKCCERGPFEDAYVRLEYRDGPSLVMAPTPQVGFRDRHTGRWVSFRLREVLEASELDMPDYSDVRLHADSEVDKQTAICKLAELGIRPPTFVELPPPCTADGTLGAEVVWTVNVDVRRAVAKIAFNYAAWKEGPHTLLTSCFDGIRRFIHAGKEDSHYVGTSRVPPDSTRVSRGHYFSLEMHNDHKLLCFVSLFNTLSYRVELTDSYPILRSFVYEQYFDPEARRVGPWPSPLWLPRSLMFSEQVVSDAD